MALLLGFLGIDPNIGANAAHYTGRKRAAASSNFEGFVIPGQCEASNPKSRDSGFTLRIAPE